MSAIVPSDRHLTAGLVNGDSVKELAHASTVIVDF
jgi:hypothetical protein